MEGLGVAVRELSPSELGLGGRGGALCGEDIVWCFDCFVSLGRDSFISVTKTIYLFRFLKKRNPLFHCLAMITFTILREIKFIYWITTMDIISLVDFAKAAEVLQQLVRVRMSPHRCS